MKAKAIKVTAQLYGQFLVSSQVNYTSTCLADHLDRRTHDNVRYFLKTSHLTPRQFWQQVRPHIVLSARGYVLFDNAVLDKHHSRRIALVRRQYSGNAHGVIVGIGLVTCVYVNPDPNRFWLIDYRFFAPNGDGNIKLGHVAEMLAPLAPRGIAYRTVLMDDWYATTAMIGSSVAPNAAAIGVWADFMSLVEALRVDAQHPGSRLSRAALLD